MIYKELQKTLNCVSKFSSLHNVGVEFSIMSVADLRGENGEHAEYWSQFEKNAGVYVLFSFDGQETKYIGKSDTDLGRRVHPMIYKGSHVVSKTDGNEVAKESSLKGNELVLVVSLKQYPYLASSLETFLIREISPTLNKTLNRKSS